MALTDPDGTDVLRVPLSTEGKFAFIRPDDYRRIVAGGLGPGWQAVWNGGHRQYVYGQHRERGTVSVAREVLGLRRGDEKRVGYHDDDPFNLRRENLTVDLPGARKIRTQRARR